MQYFLSQRTLRYRLLYLERMHRAAIDRLLFRDNVFPTCIGNGLLKQEPVEG